jgi:[protein-PII] uridylyltransferase
LLSSANPVQYTQTDSTRVPLRDEIRSYLEQHRQELRALLNKSDSAGMVFAMRHAEVMDGLVASLFRAGLLALAPVGHVPVFLGAVGGYGRGFLGWKSDLDVRLITDDAPERIQLLAETMLYPLWDAGVSIGHQVARINDLIEAARYDLPTATSLLDMRRLGGELALEHVLEERAFGSIFSEGELGAFFQRLDEEAVERHRRFGDSVYLLEPDVKSGAGGMRDLDIAFWAARARFRTSALGDLHRVGLLTAKETAEVAAAKDFLWKIRNHLHRATNRRSDRLTFDEQESLAELLGYRALVGEVSRGDAATSGAMVEAFMSDYYRHARVVLRTREQIVTRATPLLRLRRPQVFALDEQIQSFNGELTFAHMGDLDTNPALAFRLYAVAVERGLKVLAYARDAIVRAASTAEFCEALRASPEAARLFVRLVANPRQSAFRSGSILAELHDVGLLIAMIPEFSPVVGRVHHDVYHVYTVDVHSVAAVDRLRSLARGELLEEYPLASALAAEVTRPAVLYLSTLLHDVGKAIGGRDHSRRGAEMARTILGRLGFSEIDIEDACQLILQHLVMYRVAARRNLEDPATVSEFAREVGGREVLRHLFLLTVADLSTTGPTSMTKWKAHMLDELFLVTDQMLAGSQAFDTTRLQALKAAVREHWGPGDDPVFLLEYLESMPHGYLLSNGPEEIAAHARVALRGRENVVTAAVVPSRRAEVAELCVVTGERASDPLFVITGDRPGLLASISAAITGNGFDVHAAQIHSRHASDGTVQAVDLFWVTDRVGEGHFERALKKLETDLRDVITGSVAPEELLRARRSSRFSDRPVPAVATEVVIDNRTSATHTLVEVVTRDRPGLLFTLSRTFHVLGLTIGVAKINTEGTRVIDVFYVTELDGRKLDAPPRIDEVRAALLRVLDSSPPC